MKKTFIVLMLLTGSVACTDPEISATTEPVTGEQADVLLSDAGTRIGPWGIDLTMIDPDVAAGDDFFRHASGRWLESFELPADKSSYSSFFALFEKSQDRVQQLVEELAANHPAPGSVEQKIGDYYASFLNTDRLNELGYAPIGGELSAIAAIQDRSGLIRAFGRSDLDASSTPISFGILIDRKNPRRWIVGVYAGGLGLPDRDYYLEETERFEEIRSSYRDHIATLLGLVDYPFSDDSDDDSDDDSEGESADLSADELAAEVLRLETRLAEEHWPRAERRDRDLTYNLRTLAQLQADHPDFDWALLFQAAGVVPDEINVSHPSAMNPIIAIINDTPLQVWKAYLSYHLVSNNAPFLAEAIDEANFDFYGRTLRGQPQQRERWRRAISLVGGSQALGDAIGQIYVERFFPPQSKTMMLELVEDLRHALRQRISGLEWMGEETKSRAFEKLAAFLPKIGYPEQWRDYTDVTIAVGDLMGNVRQLRAYYEADAIRRLSEPTDRNEWFSTAQTVNAFYNAQFNTITFPAGILEAPFFDPAADPAVNFGAIGAVIGHEMGHGFDDQGSKSDAGGVQRDWWTDADRTRFEARAQELVTQFNGYEAVPGTFIDGAFTLGENIGDLGGLNIAYHAYRLSLNGVEPPVVDGFTGDQRFFLSFAQLWRAKIREQSLLARLKSDPHSPNEFRVNGVVRNVDAWYEAFDVGEEHALYLPPEQRVSIW